MKEIYAYPLVLFEDYQDPEQHRLLKLQPRQQILYLFDRGSLLDVVQTSNSISILKKKHVCGFGSIRNCRTPHTRLS